MPTAYQVVYWRDIPAQVKARSGRDRLARPLGDRFQKAIDVAAMRTGATGGDDYLEEWRISEWQEREGEPQSVVEALVAELESLYSKERLGTLAANGGRET